MNTFYFFGILLLLLLYIKAEEMEMFLTIPNAIKTYVFRNIHFANICMPIHLASSKKFTANFILS